jgi:hypothetical protein
MSEEFQSESYSADTEAASGPIREGGLSIHYHAYPTGFLENFLLGKKRYI